MDTLASADSQQMPLTVNMETDDEREFRSPADFESTQPIQQVQVKNESNQDAQMIEIEPKREPEDDIDDSSEQAAQVDASDSNSKEEEHERSNSKVSDASARILTTIRPRNCQLSARDIYLYIYIACAIYYLYYIYI